MNTDALIDRLAKEAVPVPRHAVSMRIGLGLLLGLVATTVMVAIWLGIRPDLLLAMHGSAFWMKWAYTLSLAGMSVLLVANLVRPESVPGKSRFALMVPVLVLGAIGALELAHTPSGEWLSMWLGRSWKACPWRVLALSVPIFAGLFWSMRRLAPTRLRAAGATAGFSAGAWAATIYCLHCPEVSAIFVLTWYTLGICIASAIGAILGPRLLRW